jgi:predicted RNA-binding protein with PUA-like domain
VHVEFRQKLTRCLSLTELKSHATAQLAELPLLKAARLSVSEVPEGCWGFILGLETAGGGAGT